MGSDGVASDDAVRLTAWQRAARRRLLKLAGKRREEPLAPEDWAAYFALDIHPGVRALRRVMRALPSSPRCRACFAPFAGPGRRLVQPLGYRPSRKNPNLCVTCVELAPPGGTTMEAGVLFADLRGFTALSETTGPMELSELLRRYYACAESVLFPEALIDKLMGDAVMALYLPIFIKGRHPAPMMLEHARDLLRRVGYGTADGPFVEVGVGIEFGEAFVGNIGQRALYDFTAVGDVVNTASRLQGEAGGGEILIGPRASAALGAPPGEPIEVTLKGKAAPVIAYRVTVDV